MFCLIGALAPPQDPLVLSELLKSILFSLVSYFGPQEPAKMVVLSMSNSIILGAMYLFFLMVLFIVVCISDLVLVCLCMQNWGYSVEYTSKNECLLMLSTMNCGVLQLTFVAVCD